MNNWFLLAAIPVFGICVLVHEFGHFITAKWAGIRVEEFGLGFPPRLVGFRKRDSGGWEVIWFRGKRNVEDDYGADKQSPFSGTSGGPLLTKRQGGWSVIAINVAAGKTENLALYAPFGK